MTTYTAKAVITSNRDHLVVVAVISGKHKGHTLTATNSQIKWDNTIEPGTEVTVKIYENLYSVRLEAIIPNAPAKADKMPVESMTVAEEILDRCSGDLYALQVSCRAVCSSETYDTAVRYTPIRIYWFDDDSHMTVTKDEAKSWKQ
jgi:hypothetical protein